MLAMLRKRTYRKILSRVDPSFYDRLTEIAAAYRETGQAMSVTRLAELYIIDAMVRDGYSDGSPCRAACSPEWTAAVFPHLEATVRMLSLSSGSEPTVESYCWTERSSEHRRRATLRRLPQRSRKSTPNHRPEIKDGRRES